MAGGLRGTGPDRGDRAGCHGGGRRDWPVGPDARARPTRCQRPPDPPGNAMERRPRPCRGRRTQAPRRRTGGRTRRAGARRLYRAEAAVADAPRAVGDGAHTLLAVAQGLSAAVSDRRARNRPVGRRRHMAARSGPPHLEPARRCGGRDRPGAAAASGGGQRRQRHAAPGHRPALRDAAGRGGGRRRRRHHGRRHRHRCGRGRAGIRRPQHIGATVRRRRRAPAGAGAAGACVLPCHPRPLVPDGGHAERRQRARGSRTPAGRRRHRCAARRGRGPRPRAVAPAGAAVPVGRAHAARRPVCAGRGVRPDR